MLLDNDRDSVGVTARVMLRVNVLVNDKGKARPTRCGMIDLSCLGTDRVRDRVSDAVSDFFNEASNFDPSGIEV